MDILAFDGNVRHLKNVIPQTQRQEIMEALKNIQWMQIRWGIREVPLPRLCSPNVETSEIGQILGVWVCEFFANTMNIHCKIAGIFGNRYRDGNDYLPDHKDQYGNLHVVSLSFGAKRLFRFSKNDGISKGGVVNPKFYLEDGDMIIFSPQQNLEYTHGIPKQKQIKEERINLTIFCHFDRNPYNLPFNRNAIPLCGI